MRGRPSIRLLVQPGEMPAYQQPQNDGGFSGSQNLPASPTGVPQHDDGGLHKSPGRPQVMVSLQDSETPPPMGTLQSWLFEGGARAWHVEPRGGHTVPVWGVSRGMEAPPQTVQIIWEIFGRAEVDLFTSEDNSYCSIFFLEGTGCAGPELA